MAWKITKDVTAELTGEISSVGVCGPNGATAGGLALILWGTIGLIKQRWGK